MRKLVKAKSVIGYQLLAMLNGFAMPVLVPLMFADQVSASVFQMYAVAILVATIADCVANAASASGNSTATFLKWSGQLTIASLILAPALFIAPWINLTLSLALIYTVNNLTAHPDFTRFYPLSPALQLISTALALIHAKIDGVTSATSLVAIMAVYLLVSTLILAAIVYKIGKKGSSFSSGTLTTPPLKIICEGLLSRSIILIAQNGLIALSPFYLPAADVVVSRVALSVQNMSRFFNLSPLSRFAIDIGASNKPTRRAFLIVALSAPLMIPAAFILAEYASLSQSPLPYSIPVLAASLAASVFVPFTPHMILGMRVGRPVLLLSLLCVLGAVSTLLLLKYATALNFLGIYVIISWVLLGVVAGFTYVERSRIGQSL